MNKKQDEQKHFRLLLFLQNCDIYLSVIPYFHMNYVQMLIVMPLYQ